MRGMFLAGCALMIVACGGGSGGSSSNEASGTAGGSSDPSLEVQDVDVVLLPDDGHVFGFAADGGIEDAAYASTEEAVIGDESTGLWRTNNRGESWVRVLDHPAEVLNAKGDLVLAATDDRVHISRDGGSTWSSGHISDEGGHDFRDGAISSASGTMYLASASAEAPGLFRSDDEGVSWEPILSEQNFDSDDQAQIQDVIAPASAGDTIYAISYGGTDIVKSVDGGESWFSIVEGLSASFPWWWSEGARVDPQDADNIILNGHVSVNGGANWTRHGEISPERTIWLDGDLVKIESQGRVRASGDYGANWQYIVELDVGVLMPSISVYSSPDSLYFHGRSIDPLYRVDLDAIREHLD